MSTILREVLDCIARNYWRGTGADMDLMHGLLTVQAIYAKNDQLRSSFARIVRATLMCLRYNNPGTFVFPKPAERAAGVYPRHLRALSTRWRQGHHAPYAPAHVRCSASQDRCRPAHDVTTRRPGDNRVVEHVSRVHSAPKAQAVENWLRFPTFFTIAGQSSGD